MSGKILKTLIGDVKNTGGIGLRPIPEAVGVSLMLPLCSFTLVHVFLSLFFFLLECFAAIYKIIQADFQACFYTFPYSHFTHVGELRACSDKMNRLGNKPSGRDTWRNYSCRLKVVFILTKPKLKNNQNTCMIDANNVL